jgi:MFS family permease
LLIGFAVLPVRGVLYTFSDDSVRLICVQFLDGVGAGIFGALTPLIIADLMNGTGRYNLALGMVKTAQGVGASISGLIAGLLVDHLGYDVAFLTSGAVASVVLAVHETSPVAASASSQMRVPSEVIWERRLTSETQRPSRIRPIWKVGLGERSSHSRIMDYERASRLPTLCTSFAARNLHTTGPDVGWPFTTDAAALMLALVSPTAVWTKR